MGSLLRGCPGRIITLLEGTRAPTQQVCSDHGAEAKRVCSEERGSWTLSRAPQRGWSFFFHFFLCVQFNLNTSQTVFGLWLWEEGHICKYNVFRFFKRRKKYFWYRLATLKDRNHVPGQLWEMTNSVQKRKQVISFGGAFDQFSSELLVSGFHKRFLFSFLDHQARKVQNNGEGSWFFKDFWQRAINTTLILTFQAIYVFTTFNIFFIRSLFLAFNANATGEVADHLRARVRLGINPRTCRRPQEEGTTT